MKTIVSLFTACLFIFLVYSCSETTASENAQSAVETTLAGDALIQRGEYLVNTMSCNDCHSPKIMTDRGPEPDPSRLLSGHPAKMPAPDVDQAEMGQKGLVVTSTLTAWVGPWGTSYAANLTSDDTGIGTWSFEQFKKAISQGKFKGLDGNRTLLPPMPWPNLVNTTDDDLKAMFAYLKSLPPIKNVVPQPVPPATM